MQNNPDSNVQWNQRWQQASTCPWQGLRTPRRTVEQSQDRQRIPTCGLTTPAVTAATRGFQRARETTLATGQHVPRAGTPNTAPDGERSQDSAVHPNLRAENPGCKCKPGARASLRTSPMGTGCDDNICRSYRRSVRRTNGRTGNCDTESAGKRRRVKSAALGASVSTKNRM